MQHRRQAKGDQQRQPDADAKQHRPHAGRRQRGVDQTGQQRHEHVVHGVADQHAGRAGGQPDQHELDRVRTGDGALRQAQHAQHGAIVQMPRRKAARGQRHRHGRQQRRQQRHQAEELLGAVERACHLGSAAAQRFQPHAVHLRLFHLGLGPGQVLAHRRLVARHGQAVGDATGRLHQAGGAQVGGVQHHARGEGHEAGAAVGFQRDQLGNAKTGVAQQQRIAAFQRQRFEQRGIDPNRAALGDAGRGLAFAVCGITRQPQLTAQRIAVAHRLQRHQPRRAALCVVRAAHGRERERQHVPELEPIGLLDPRRGGRVVADHHRIATQQLARVALQAGLQAVGKKAHRRERRHRQRDGHHQQPQLARAQVAPQGAPAQRPEGCVHDVHLNARLSQASRTGIFE